MQPKSSKTYDEKSFNILKRTIKNISISKRERKDNPVFATELPESVAIKLTNRCNLRCTHCYQWNDSGYHNNMDKQAQSQDIDLEIVKKVLDETRLTKSRLYLWGGEPLCHNNFAKIAQMLVENPRETSLCTNGILIDKHLDSILKISSNLELLIAVEGFEDEHDKIRGKGTFQKVMDTIDLLNDLRKKGFFTGKISIHTVIHDVMVGKLHGLLELFEAKGIDLVLLCFPWYLSEETSIKMDHYFCEKFHWLKDIDEEGKNSWHAFKYRFNPEKIPELMEEIKKINEKTWSIRVRYQPALETDEIEEFISGSDKPGQKLTKCLALSTRMDIDPDGSVSACKLFSEFKVGNLKTESLYDIWHGETYNRIRKIINEGLMPACSKCNVLYLHSV